MVKAYGKGDGNKIHPGDGKSYDYSQEVPYYERFYLGGVGSLRGYDFRGISPVGFGAAGQNHGIGGEAMASASVEAFFPIWERLVRGSVFFDTGTVWRYAGDPKYASKLGANNNQLVLDQNSTKDSAMTNTDRKFRYSWGVGLHIKTPLGPMPVRLYYAFPMGKKSPYDETQRFQFTMGALF
jgi:outer membrane protein insertion porin family